MSDGEESLLDEPERSRRSAELQAFAAPFSRTGNTVLPDPSEAAALTLAISELFLDAETPPALTRGEICAELAGQHRRTAVERQIERLIAGGVLLPDKGRPRERRYRLKVVGYLGALFAERVDEAGLLDDFWGLLDRTRGRLGRDELDAERLQADMVTIRRGLIGYAGELQAVAEHGSRDEVVAECRRHDRVVRTAQVERLCREVEAAHPELRALTTRSSRPRRPTSTRSSASSRGCARTG